MFTVQVEKHDGPAKRALASGLRLYNRRKVGTGKPAAFVVSLREDDVISGGASAQLWHGWVYVDRLWIDEAARGKGHGRALMAALEAEAKRRGARGVHLTTHGWQARPFYERCGYKLFGELPDYPPGHACFFLVKML